MWHQEESRDSPFSGERIILQLLTTLFHQKALKNQQTSRRSTQTSGPFPPQDPPHPPHAPKSLLDGAEAVEPLPIPFCKTQDAASRYVFCTLGCVCLKSHSKHMGSCLVTSGFACSCTCNMPLWLCHAFFDTRCRCLPSMQFEGGGFPVGFPVESNLTRNTLRKRHTPVVHHLVGPTVNA